MSHISEVDSEIQGALCPVEDCRLAVDLRISSVDGVLFGTHQSNLEHYSEGFPFAASTVVEDVVPFEQRADVLRLMLKYVHNTRQPDLSDIPFLVLSSLAEAVEKYLIYSAMEVCRIHMKLSCEDYPVQVFVYAAKHDYLELSNQAARLTMETPVATFLRLAKELNLSEIRIFQWYRYREHWNDILTQLVIQDPPIVMNHRGSSAACDLWPPFHIKIVARIGSNLGKLLEMSTFLMSTSF